MPLRSLLAVAAIALAIGACRSEPSSPSIPRSCVAFERPDASSQIGLERVFAHVSFREGVAMRQPPGDDQIWVIVSKHGIVQRFDTRGEEPPTTFIDISPRIATAAEAGLLGLAFHPDFAANGQVFLSYTAPGGAGAFVSRVSRFASPDGVSLDPDSEQIVIEIDQPYRNHNGGDIHFGPDGMLYLGLGDGGSARDPHGHGQNTDTLLGSMLRIDVEGASSYAIPPDNPFAQGGGRPEIFAWGLRNVWRFSFDRETGELWAGDVGQFEWEEVDKIELGRNYGWNIREAAHCFASDSCTADNLTDPIAEYANPDPASVIGGYVYRGTTLLGLIGTYLYADFYLGTIWGVVEGQPPQLLFERPGLRIAAFAEGNNGELYVLHYDGEIYRIDTGAEASGAKVPALLSHTGCVDANVPTEIHASMMPYEVNVPFWSDSADKERFIAIPEGGRIEVGSAGDWQLPVGTVLLKNFRRDSALIETRLFMRHPDGEWGGYTYAWNGEGSDAELLAGQHTREGPQAWIFPGRSQCLECHSQAAGYSLGLETGQLAVNDQLQQFVARGWLTEVPPGDPWVDSANTEADLHLRARTYLHVNCSSCHRPEGTSRAAIDLRMTTPLAMMGICDVAPEHGDLGLTEARIVAPGEPGRSTLTARMRTSGPDRMPDIGSLVVDEAGAALIEAWIEAMTGCP